MGPLAHFAEMKYYRLPRKLLHYLTDIVLIGIAAILTGAEGWGDMVQYCKAK